MLTVSLLRHAKSSQNDAGLDDFDRPLAGRGRLDAPQMAAYIKSQAIAPDLILCSAARRTRETLELVLAELAAERPEVTITRDFYLADSNVLLARLRRLPAVVKHVMIVGHNPGLQVLALDLVGHGERAEINAIAVKFPSCGLAVVDFDAARWRDLRTGAGHLRLFMSPKRLPSTSVRG